MCHDKQCNPHVMHTLLGADSFRLAGGCRTACAPSHSTSKTKAALAHAPRTPSCRRSSRLGLHGPSLGHQADVQLAVPGH